MVLKYRRFVPPVLVLLAAALLGPAGAAVAAEPAGVTLPLAEYLALLDRAEQRDREAAASARGREPGLAEVVEERIAVRLEEKDAKVDSFFEVLVQGEPSRAVWLPLAGYGAAATIEKLDARGAWGPAPGAALSAFGGAEGGAMLVATVAGRYRVKAESRLPVDPNGGLVELRLLQVAAPVASAEIDLPAELEWSSAGAVLVSENVAGGRRKVGLATQRGQAPLLQARRRLAQGDEKALVHTVVLTLLQLRPEGLRRHDVLLYEVSRGRLSAFEVSLPAGLEVEQAATDEGVVVPIEGGGKLRVERRRQLQGIGYLVLSSTPAAAGTVPLTLVRPDSEVRARYLAVASSLAADIAPLPSASFSQIDLTDLPPLLGEALGAVDLAAAWRLQEGAAPESGLALRLAPLPAAASVAGTVTRRETTTLLTVDGTLLHRETFELAASDRPASSFEVTLPERAVLWSAKVDGQPTRPLQRDGKVVLPIVPKRGATTTVEVVAVLEQAIAAGRSQLQIDLAQVAAPVLEHSWRLLLPEGPKYRFAGGELRPVPAALFYAAMAMGPAPAPLQEADLGRLAALESASARAPAGLEDRRAGKRKDGDGAAARDEEKEERLAAANYSAQIGELQQGLVGGVKPLPVTIPETGKALVLTGVLPPERVSVTIDVKAKRP